MSSAMASGKRAGDEHDDGDKGDGRRVSQRTEAGASSAHRPQFQGLELPPPLHFTADPATLKPEQLLDHINGLTRLRYARDLMKIFVADGNSAEIFEMRHLWLTVRRPSTDEMMGHGQKPSGFRQILEGVSTMHDLLNKLEKTKEPRMYRFVSMILFDYVMLLYIEADLRDVADEKIVERTLKAKQKVKPNRVNSNVLGDVRSHALNFEGLFASLADTLREVTSPRDPGSRLVPTFVDQRHEDPAISQADREEINLLKVVKGSQAMSNDGIAGYTEAKTLLDNAINEVINTPHLTARAGTSNAVLLYGPPGTGKTSMATSVAGGFPKCTVYQTSCSQLFSKWVGGSERTVKALFAVANENRPAVIILDEIEALCGSRESDDSGSAKRFASELLQKMTVYAGVVVVGTTNFPWLMDSAFMRRFSNHVHMGLPDMKTRYEMFRLILNNYVHVLMEADLRRLAESTENCSGSIVRRIVSNTATALGAQARKATHFRKIKFRGNECFLVSSPSEKGGERRSYESVSHQLEPGPITLAMLRHTIQSGHGLQRPDQEIVRKCLKWAGR